MCSLTVLNCGRNGSGVSAAISIISPNNKETTRIVLLNVGDSTQKFCNEYRIKLRNVDTVFVTSLAPHNISGLPALLLSLSDLGNKRLNIVGQIGIRNLIESMRVFTNRRYPELVIHEINTPELQSVSLGEVKFDIQPLLASGTETIVGLSTLISIHWNSMRPFTLGCVGYCQSYSTIPSLDEVYHLLSASNPSGPAVLFIPIQVGGGGDLGLRKYFQDLCCRLHIGGLLVDLHLDNTIIEFRQAQIAISLNYLSSMSSFGHLDSYITRPFPSILHELNLERGTDPDIHSGREQSFFGWSETRLDPFFRDQLVIVEPFMTLCFTDDDQYQIQYLVKQPTDIVRAVDLLRNDWNLQACVVASSIVQNERSQESNYVTSQRLRLALHKRRHPIQHRSQVTISLLGTGSASPSRHRSNSAILVDISDSTSSSSILLDAGESCMAQLFYSCHGDANYMRSILQSLSVVWISHHHADHHCGLSLLLEETFRIQRTKKLIVIAPQSVISYHQYISCVCGIDDIVEFLPIELTVPCYPSLPECFIKAQNEIALSTNNIIRELQSIRVQHCHDSFGVILKLSTHQKIVYSGDCRPSKHLVALGTNCDILIHEATFDDDKITDARSKRHSTISEGIQIGSDMAANHTILTHFSQRYPRTPAVSNANVTIAHDFLKVTMLK